MTVEPQPHQVDVLVLGAGAAGLTAALSITENLSVGVLTKDPSGGSTRWAQGGVAAVIDDQDSIESHVDDTLIVGAGLCHQMVEEHIVSGAREAIDWLIDQGVVLPRQMSHFILRVKEVTPTAGFCMPPMPLDGPSKTHCSGAQAQPKTSMFIIISSQLICVLTGAVDLKLVVSVVAMC